MTLKCAAGRKCLTEPGTGRPRCVTCDGPGVPWANVECDKSRHLSKDASTSKLSRRSHNADGEETQHRVRHQHHRRRSRLADVENSSAGRPVCASDGVTNDSWCNMKKIGCLAGKALDAVSEGGCRSAADAGLSLVPEFRRKRPPDRLSMLTFDDEEVHLPGKIKWSYVRP